MSYDTPVRPRSPKQLARSAEFARLRQERQAAEQAKRLADWAALTAQASTARTIDLDQLAEQGVNNRALWLIFALVERYEHVARTGNEVRSTTTREIDWVAPRAPKKVSRQGKTDEQYERELELARYPGNGLNGFAVRFGAKLPDFVELSHNGYVYPRPAAFELVFRLRELNPHLATRPNLYRPCVLSHGLTLPQMQWREMLRATL